MWLQDRVNLRVFGPGSLLGERISTERSRASEDYQHHGSAHWLEGQHRLPDLRQSPEQRWTRTLQPRSQHHHQETT